MISKFSLTRVPSSKKNHIYSAFDDELEELYKIITKMAELATSQLEMSIEIIVEKKVSYVKKVDASDRRLGKLEREVDRLCTRILALRQPMAVDLRRIVSAMKIASDIEHFGDYSKNVARRVKSLTTSPIPHVSMLEHLSSLVKQMWEKVLEAYKKTSPDLALSVFAMDDMVDEHYTGLFREMITYMMEDPRQIGQCIHMLFIAKNLEKMGDLATSVSEEVYYQETGKLLTESKINLLNKKKLNRKPKS